jgi:sec-independent protein translocase protein TatA
LVAMVGDILQPTHLVFVLIIALVVLGPKRLPEVGRALGNGLRDFRAAINGEHEDHPSREPQPDLPPPELAWESESATEPEPVPSPAAAPGQPTAVPVRVAAGEHGPAPEPGAQPAGTADSGH